MTKVYVLFTTNLDNELELDFAGVFDSIEQAEELANEHGYADIGYSIKVMDMNVLW